MKTDDEFLTKSATYEIHALDGDTKGVLRIKRPNWAGLGLAFPRSKWKEILELDEMQQPGPGVYLLEGCLSETRAGLYIGQSKDVKNRISQHDENQDEPWNRGIVFVSPGGGLNRDHVEWLEYALIDRVREAGRCHLRNKTVPREPSLDIADKATAQSFLREILQILSLSFAGLGAIQPRSAVASPPADSPEESRVNDAREDRLSESRLMAVGKSKAEAVDLPKPKDKAPAREPPSPLEEAESSPTAWELDLRNKPIGDSPQNARVLLSELGYKVKWDKMANCCVVVLPSGEEEVLNDHHWNEWYTLAREKYSYSIAPKRMFQHYIYHEARENMFHPVKDYLKSCPVPEDKDEAGRLLFETAIKGFAVHPNDQTSQIAIAKTLAAAARRIKKPDYLWEYILVLCSRPDNRRTLSIAALIPNDKWFLSPFIFGDSQKDRRDSLSGIWIAEIEDIEGVSSSQMRPILSRGRDRYRGCIFVGATNNLDSLRRSTANERFWPIVCQGRCNPEWIERNRDKVWGAAALYEKEAKLWMDEELYRKAIEERQESYRARDPWEDLLGKKRDFISGMTANDILVEVCQVKPTKREQMRLAGVLRLLKFDKHQITRDHGRVVVWLKGKE